MRPLSPSRGHSWCWSQRGVKRVCHLFDRHSLLSMCAQVESGVLETFLVVDNDSSKRRSGRGGSHSGAGGDWLSQSPRETPAWLSVCTRLACDSASLACSLEAPYAGPPSSLFLHIVACVAHINVYLCLSSRKTSNVRFWRRLVHARATCEPVARSIQRAMRRRRPAHGPAPAAGERGRARPPARERGASMLRVCEKIDSTAL